MVNIELGSLKNTYFVSQEFCNQQHKATLSFILDMIRWNFEPIDIAY